MLIPGGVNHDGNTLGRTEISNQHWISSVDMYPTMTRTKTAASCGTCA
jgi:hypothetical protein